MGLAKVFRDPHRRIGIDGNNAIAESVDLWKACVVVAATDPFVAHGNAIVD